MHNEQFEQVKLRIRHNQSYTILKKKRHIFTHAKDRFPQHYKTDQNGFGDNWINRLFCSRVYEQIT